MSGNKRRWAERGKNALIALLTLSAVWLLSMTPLVRDSGLLDLLRPAQAPGGASAGAAQAGAVLPARLAVCRDGGRCGLQYDDARVEELFTSLGPLLGDALTAADQPRQLTETEWRSHLQAQGAYFDFDGGVPLAALAGWLGGEGPCPLPGCARRVLLVPGEGDGILLCWQDVDTGGFYACDTALSHSLHLDAALAGAEPNNAYFAFEDPSLSPMLDPYTLIAEGGGRGIRYAAANPLAAAAGTEALLDALSFNSQNHAAGSSGEVYLDGGDRLVVGSAGDVTYRAAQGDKYPVGSDTAAAAAGGARSLAERAMVPLCGDARLYLISVQPWKDGWRVRFGYRLDGSAVYLYDEGWAAEFFVQGGFITAFTLHLRCYTAGEDDVLLPPVGRAAVMLPDLTDRPRELLIRYRDWGGPSVAPGWGGV